LAFGEKGDRCQPPLLLPVSTAKSQLPKIP
jgi:hypothetical protein